MTLSTRGSIHDGGVHDRCGQTLEILRDFTSCSETIDAPIIIQDRVTLLGRPGTRNFKTPRTIRYGSESHNQELTARTVINFL